MPSGKANDLPFAKYNFSMTFRQLKNFSYCQTKREISLLGSDHFWMFQRKRKRIMASGKAHGLPFAKYHFERRFGNL
jgi:hypothetical protein